MSSHATGTAGRRLVLLFDGTWNRREHTTNVWRTKLLVEASDRQLVYYDQGVGTDRAERIRGGAFGTGLSRKVLAGYLWLMENFRPAEESPDGIADEIFIFGFSRGAYTARSLTGFLSLCGLLKGDAAVSVSRAFDLSRIPALKRQSPVMQRFRRTFSLEVRVRFVGVWDTVGALGIPQAKWLAKEQPDVHKIEMQEIVEHTRHALALDEHRRKFAPAIWEPKPLTRTDETGHDRSTLEQRWFIGSHANVGGGYARDGLCLRPLQWMLDEAATRGLTLRPRVSRLDDVFYASQPRDPLGEIGLGSYYLTQGFKRFDRPVALGGLSRQTLDYTVLERWLWDPTYEVPSLAGVLGEKRKKRSRTYRLTDAQIEKAFGGRLVPCGQRGFVSNHNEAVMRSET